MTDETSKAPPVWAVAAVFLAAWIARTAPVVFVPNIHHPDEIFQSLEQAHRIVFGYGFIPWEFEHAVRSWILPGFIAGLMRLSRFLGEGPSVYLPFIGSALGAIGAAAVVCVFLWAYRLFGLALALVAAAVPAFAPELIHFGGKALTEVVGGHLLVIAIYLAFPGRDVESRGRLAAAGGLAALAVAIRLQIAPAVALVGLVALLRWPWRKAVWPALGGAAVVVFAGALDWATWGAPFLSYWHNFTYNITYGVSSHFGVQPWFDYPAQLLVVWGGALVAILGFAVIGAGFQPLLAGVALVVLATHLPIAHKELRFLYPLMFIVQALVGLGIAASVRWLTRSDLLASLPGTALRPAWRIAAGVALLGLFIIGRLPGFMMTPAAGSAWIEKKDDVEASLAISRLPSVCGIGGYGVRWAVTGGYTQMHQPAPFFEATGPEDFAAKLPAFNTVIFDKALLRHVGLASAQCFGERCVAQRAGTCEARPVEPLSLPPQLEGVRRVRELWPPPADQWRAARP
jgi:phosphatidylinositol glycan class B